MSERERAEYAFLKDVESADGETQCEMMRKWFTDHHREPSALDLKSLPVSSAYSYVYEGPYEPYDDLRRKFAVQVPDHLIQQVADEFSSRSTRWYVVLDDEEVRDLDEVFWVAVDPGYHEHFGAAMQAIQRLLAVKVGKPERPCFYRLLYANVIMALEAYLSDAFECAVMGDPDALRKFVESTPEFQKQKVAMSGVFKHIDEMEQKVREFLHRFPWHGLVVVRAMYEATLGVAMPGDLRPFLVAVNKRHDIVHRNGKDRDGRDVEAGLQEVSELIRIVCPLVAGIQAQLEMLPPCVDAPADERADSPD
jgi:hypothetical protein